MFSFGITNVFFRTVFQAVTIGCFAIIAVITYQFWPEIHDASFSDFAYVYLYEIGVKAVVPCLVVTWLLCSVGERIR